MKVYVTEEEKKAGYHKIQLEDLTFYSEFAIGENKNWVLSGMAVVEDEKYHDFTIQIELSDETVIQSFEDLIRTDWEWYDYLFGI